MLRRVGILVVLVVSLSVVVGSAVAAAAVYRVQGASMSPTLGEGDLLLANPLVRTPARFAVVVYDSSGQATVKRVVGMPGDGVRIRGRSEVQVQPGGSDVWQRVVDADGRPWPNGSPPVQRCCTPDGRASTTVATAVVPPGHYFVLGDNPEESIDSRAQGFVAAERVRAVGVLVPIGGGSAPPRLAPLE